MRALLAGLLVVLSGCVGQAHSFLPSPEAPLPGAPGIHPLTLQVGGAPAHGLLGVPAGGTSDTLVVLAKGFGVEASAWRPVMEELAARGALSVAMEYRGAPDAWKVRAAAEDTLAATLALRREHPEVERVVLYGISMGGEVSGLALARAPPGTYTHWLAGAGVMDLRSEWQAALTFRPSIEAEAGGTPFEAPDAYRELSPVDQAEAIAAQRLQRAYLVHGLADAVVPAEQSERMAQALARAGVPVSLTLVATGRDAWVCTPLVVACASEPLPAGPAGHEAGFTKAALDILWALAAGEEPRPAQRSVVEGVTGSRVALDVPATSSPRAATLPP